jgi:hypothetical protein
MKDIARARTLAIVLVFGLALAGGTVLVVALNHGLFFDADGGPKPLVMLPMATAVFGTALALFSLILLLVIFLIPFLSLIRRYGLSLALIRYKRAHCEHRHWKEISYGKRRCTECGTEQWLMQRKYPQAGEPAIYWEDMSRDELQFL